MLALSIKALLSLLLCVNTMPTFVFTGHEEQMELSEIEVAKECPLSEILEDILEDSSPGDTPVRSLYVFSISKYSNGLRVDIHKEENGKISDGIIPLGYFSSGKNIIVVNAGDWLIKEGYVTRRNKSDGVAFTLESRNPGVIYDPDSWIFYILNGNYARYVRKIGWVWTLCNDETDRRNLHRFLIESPKRNGHR